MARMCAVAGCNKKPRVANLVSHANNRTKRWVYPNVHMMRFVYAHCSTGTVHRGNVCTKCVKAGLVKKVI